MIELRIAASMSFIFMKICMAPSAGFEPAATDLEKRCSFQLSYEDVESKDSRDEQVAGPQGLEPQLAESKSAVLTITPWAKIMSPLVIHHA